jgi:hypothetical protein
MNLPATLTQLIEQARRDMREDPMHDLRLGYRLAIYSALGPRADQPVAPDLSGYRRRVFLEYQTAKRLLPAT